jgi:hypothetical protein
MTVIFLLFVAALFWILASVNQRSLYWKTRARAYRNPEANEPSDFAYAMQRGLFIVFGLIFTIGSIVVATALGWFTGNENQVRSAAEEAVEALNGDLVGGSSVGDRETGLFADQVEFEVQLAEPLDVDLLVEHTSGERYTVSTDEGEDPVCIAITTEEDAILVPGGGDGNDLAAGAMYELSTTQSDGACDA